jgi:regulator of protease activity HflC (stomatin/prohibitin superfamily)
LDDCGTWCREEIAMKRWVVCAGLLFTLSSCGGAVVTPGHRGILFDPKAGGIRPDVLRPGYYAIGSCFLRWVCPQIDEFDITYTTHKEDIVASSSEGLVMETHIAIIFRPIESELFLLDTEVGPNYYDEVVGPEFRSASRGVLARHSYGDLQKANEKVEDEIEVDVRRRIKGKHVEIASVTIESVKYAPEISQAVQNKLIGEQEAARQRALVEADAARKKAEIQLQSEQERLRADASVQQKKNERTVAEHQAAIDKLKAESESSVRVTRAKGIAEETRLLAKAEAEKNAALTPLQVQMHAYDALGKLGGTGTTIYLGDWSHAPRFLFPNMGWQGAAYPPQQ